MLTANVVLNIAHKCHVNEEIWKKKMSYFQDVFLQGLDVFQSLWILVDNYHLL